MSAHTSRRSFLAASALAGATTLRGGTGAMATEKKPVKKLRVGVFGLDYSYWPGIWADLLSPTGTHVQTSILNMQVACVWDKDEKKAQDFASKWDCEVVKKYDGMLGKVDGVVNGELYNVPWQHKMFRPYLEAGVPTYLSRPWSTRLRDMDSMLELAAKHNTPLCASATHEHYNEADNFKDKLKNVGEIQTVFATCVANDRPHFHIPFMMMKILGYNVEQISLLTNDPNNSAYLQCTYIYSKTDQQPSYALSMTAAPTDIYNFTIYGKDGTESARMPGESNFFYRFVPQLIDIQKTLEGKTYQPLDIVRKKFEAQLAEYYSHYERGGAPVTVGTVPPDWQYPIWKPDWYSDADFKD
jgi:predicted dehydrogenase